MWLYIGLGLIAVLLYILMKDSNSNNDYWDKRGVPTASGCDWFFGHYKPIFLVKKHMNDFCDAMYKEFPEAAVVGYYMMNMPALLVKDLEIVKTILMTEFSSFNVNVFTIKADTNDLGTTNPFFHSGEEWKTSRTRITPPLSLAKLKGYLPNMLKVGDQMIKYLKETSGESALELETRELAKKYSTDVIANALYGVKNNTFEDENSTFAELTREINFEFSLMENLKVIVQQIPILSSIFPMRITSKKLQGIMVSLTDKIIEERTKTGEKRNDVYQALMDLKEKDTQGIYTNEFISGQVLTVITDLYESSSNAIALSLYMISRHSDIQEKLRSEIKEIISKNNGELSIEDIENAKYLDMVFCESLRMFSFVSTKTCTQDCYLPMPGSDPLKITKGTSIVIPVSSIHMDPKYYPDPEKFDPERWTDDQVASRPKFSFMPFGEGPRKCVGMRIATLEIKVAIIKIIESFTLKPSPKTKYPIEADPAAAVTLRPKGGAWVIFKQNN